MKGMLVNIDELIRNSLVQTNGTVSWETIATSEVNMILITDTTQKIHSRESIAVLQ